MIVLLFPLPKSHSLHTSLHRLRSDAGDQVCINLKTRCNLEPQGCQEADCELDDWEATGSICSRLITGTATLPDAEADCKHMQWSEELGSQGDEQKQVQEVGATKRGTLHSHRCPNLPLELP